MISGARAQRARDLHVWGALSFGQLGCGVLRTPRYICKGRVSECRHPPQDWCRPERTVTVKNPWPASEVFSSMSVTWCLLGARPLEGETRSVRANELRRCRPGIFFYVEEDGRGRLWRA